MTRKTLILLMAIFIAACDAQPLTPPPPTATNLPRAAAIVMTFTPVPTVIALPSEMPVPTDTLPPTDTLSPTDVPAPVESAPQLVIANPVLPSVPTAIPPVLVAPPPSADVAAAEQYCIDLINAQRAAVGVAPLARDETLMGIAHARVADMVARGYTGHTDPVTGERLARAMMRAAGYTSNYVGENWYGTINAPPAIIEIAMNWFMTDPPHANNILSPNFVSIGVGIAYNGRQWLLVQNFAGQ